MATSSPETAIRKPWYQRIGPGLITACVVIGPGSILTSSNVGSKYEYGMSWVVVIAVVCMLAYTTMAAKIGTMSDRSLGDLVTERVGRWLAVLIGLGVFFISAAFQFGNNLGVHSAFEQLLTDSESKWLVESGTLVVGFNILSIMFLFVAKNLYKLVERLMMVFVSLMLISFAINLAFAKPDLGQLARGFVPRGDVLTDLNILGLVGTTFVITAAFYQAYLVKQKGWGEKELEDGLIDARVGAVIMGLITLTIMSTSAAVLSGVKLTSVGDVAQQLEPTFGEKGLILFCLGLFSAAYSSFIVNSMIGGFILSDGLGIGSKPTDLAPRILTAVALLTGMGVAMVVINLGIQPVPAIVAAQALTVLASPLMAGTILWLANKRDILGEKRNGWFLNLLGGFAFLMLLAMAVNTAATKVYPQLQEWAQGKTEAEQSPASSEASKKTSRQDGSK